MVKYCINFDNPTFPHLGVSGIAVAMSYCACCLVTAE